MSRRFAPLLLLIVLTLVTLSGCLAAPVTSGSEGTGTPGVPVVVEETAVPASPTPTAGAPTVAATATLPALEPTTVATATVADETPAATATPTVEMAVSTVTATVTPSVEMPAATVTTTVGTPAARVTATVTPIVETPVWTATVTATVVVDTPVPSPTPSPVLEHYQGPNPYRSTPLFDVTYDASVWQFVADDGSGRHSQLKHRTIDGCSIWLRAGPVNASPLAEVYLAGRAWTIVLVQPNVIEYVSPEDDFAWIFGLIEPAPHSGRGNSECQDAAEQVIDTFMILP